MVERQRDAVNIGGLLPEILDKAQGYRGIPTMFVGVRFRSRLEARWAALFDELKIPWEYEPTDLVRYIPDFILNFPRKRLLVEIKPTDEHIAYAKHKIKHSGWDGDSLIATSAQTREWGMMIDASDAWDTAMLGFCKKCSRVTIASACGSWECRSCDGANRDIWWAYDCAEAWKRAGNLTQWRPGS